MRTLDECVAEIKRFMDASDSPTFCGGTMIPKQLVSEMLAWIERLVELCDAKSVFGEHTESCDGGQYNASN